MEPGEAQGAAAGAAAAGGAPGDAAFRLDQGTYSDEGRERGDWPRKVRAKYPKFQSVAVPEVQQRGAWHWHLAVRGWQDVAFLRSAWRSIVGEGNVDVSPPRYGTQDRRLSIVRYLSKYLAKGLGEALALNRHRFRASRGIAVPLRVIRLPVRSKDDALQATRKLVAAAAGAVGFHFVSEEYASGVVFSWN